MVSVCRILTLHLYDANNLNQKIEDKIKAKETLFVSLCFFLSVSAPIFCLSFLLVSPLSVGSTGGDKEK